MRALRSEDTGQARACPDRTRAIPCTVRRRAINVQLARATSGQSRILLVRSVGWSAASAGMICPIPKLTVRVLRARGLLWRNRQWLASGLGFDVVLGGELEDLRRWGDLRLGRLQNRIPPRRPQGGRRLAGAKILPLYLEVADPGRLAASLVRDQVRGWRSASLTADSAGCSGLQAHHRWWSLAASSSASASAAVIVRDGRPVLPCGGLTRLATFRPT